MKYIEDRETLNKWGKGVVRKVKLSIEYGLIQGRPALDEYQDRWNAYSLDGLPGLKTSRRRIGKSLAIDRAKAWARGVWRGKLDAVLLGWLIGVFIAIINEIVQRYLLN